VLHRTIATTIAVGLIATPVAFAAKPTKPTPPTSKIAVSLTTSATAITFTQAVTLKGKLTGGKTGGVIVKLELDKTGFLGDKFDGTALTAKTSSNGNFSFAVKPSANTIYRVVALTSPQVISGAKTVRVRPQVGITASDTTPKAGALVRFSGSVRPSHDGSVVLIQRRTSTGTWGTIGRSTLRAASTGLGKSVYAKSLKVSKSGFYRVKLAAHDDHLTGVSRTVALVVE
jgi:hypothetical protein